MPGSGRLRACAFADIAPILCAGVTVYKGIRMTDTRLGQWITISGIGGLGHVAVQYSIAMGLRVVAVDISTDKLALARERGATLTLNASQCDVAAAIQKEIGGTHGVLVTAVSRSAFAQALGMVRRGGTVVLNGLPPGDFPLPIFSTVLNGITVRGSIVGTRKDLQESLEFAAQGRVRARVHIDRLDNINHVFTELKSGRVDGRVVLKLD
jgi:propanol-preferring alcohol dehydrogenase